MDRRTVGVVVALGAALGIVGVTALVLQDGPDERSRVPDYDLIQESPRPEHAHTYRSLQRACDALRKRGLLRRSPPATWARVAVDDLAQELWLAAAGPRGQGIGLQGIGLRRCSGHPVILVTARGDHEPIPASGVGPTPVVIVPAAHDSHGPAGATLVHVDFDAACVEWREDDPSRTNVSHSAAEQTVARLLSSEALGTNSDVSVLGARRCEDSWVVALGVSSVEAQVPRHAPGGVPVLVYLQPRFHLMTPGPAS